MSYLQVPAVKLFKTKKNGNSILEKTVSALGQTDPEEEADIKKKRKILLAINNLNKKNSKKVSSPAINLRQKIKNRIVTLPVSSLPLKDSEMKKSVSNKKNRTIKDKILSKFKTNSLGKNTNYSFNNFSPFFNSSPLTIDAIFNPITKVNYIIEVNDYKTTQTSFETSFETLELFEILNMTKTETRLIDFAPSERIDTRIRSDNSASNNLKSLNLNTFGSTGSVVNKNSNFLENILQIKREINILKKEIPKHNIIFEVWTNGSIHPRDAIYQGFKNLVKLFSKLNKINAFMINPLILNSLQYNNNVPNSTNENKQIKKDFFFKKIKQNEISPTFSDQTLSTLSSDLLPLNETSFLSTYMAPKIKNYYPALPARWAGRADKNSDNLSTKKAFPALASSPCDNSMGGHASSSRERIRKEFAGETYISGTQLEYKNNSIRDSKDSLPGSNSLEKLNKKLILENLDLSILNLSLRSYTYLKRLNINTVEEVRLFLKNKSSNLKKLSKVCLEEIERSLEIIGF
jgi:DNA-directed RNA polymerase alpha subunit